MLLTKENSTKLNILEKASNPCGRIYIYIYGQKIVEGLSAIFAFISSAKNKRTLQDFCKVLFCV